MRVLLMLSVLMTFFMMVGQNALAVSCEQLGIQADTEVSQVELLDVRFEIQAVKPIHHEVKDIGLQLLSDDETTMQRNDTGTPTYKEGRTAPRKEPLVALTAYADADEHCSLTLIDNRCRPRQVYPLKRPSDLLAATGVVKNTASHTTPG
jgi:hypothetical protein